jgi:hypothetical protein
VVSLIIFQIRLGVEQKVSLESSHSIETAYLAGLLDDPGTHGAIYLDRLTSVTRQPVYRPHSVEITVSGGEDMR